MKKVWWNKAAPLRRGRGALATVLAVGLLAGCAARGAVDDSVVRTATWFSYVGGADMKSRCLESDGTRMRLVYNAVWGEQVNTWDLLPSATGEGGVVIFRQFAGGILGDLDFSNLQRTFDRLGGVHERAELTAPQWAELQARAARTFTEPALAPGSFLRSDSYYLVLARCNGSQVQYAAWSSDDRPLTALPLLAGLREASRSAARIVDDKPLNLHPFPSNAGGARERRNGDRPVFVLQVGQGGLQGVH